MGDLVGAIEQAGQLNIWKNPAGTVPYIKLPVEIDESFHGNQSRARDPRSTRCIVQ